jgi:hypothetical protein
MFLMSSSYVRVASISKWLIANATNIKKLNKILKKAVLLHTNATTNREY